MKEVVKVKVDREFGTTNVTIRASDFLNFGQRMGELQRKATEALLAPGPDDDAIPKAIANLNQLFEQNLKKMADGPLKNQTIEMMKESAREMENAKEADGIEVEVDPEEFTHDLQTLSVSVPEGMKWDGTTEAKVDNFLAAWPQTRPAVLKATAQYYKKIFPATKEFLGDEPGIEFTLPKPGAAEIVADLFRISTIYLRDDGSIGLGCPCTWDEEHGYGIVLNNGKVIATGGEDEAFN
jgi:hypothetical protein